MLQDLLLPSRTSKNPPLVLIEYDVTRSPLPVLRSMLKDTDRSSLVILCLHPQRSLLGPKGNQPANTTVLDFTDRIPGYGPEGNMEHEVLKAVDYATSSSKQSLDVYLDSADTLVADMESSFAALSFIKQLLQKIKAHANKSRLILPISSSSAILTYLLPTSFSPSLTHLRLHPPHLLLHLSDAFLLPPPPITPEPKFWSVFGPFSARERGEGATLVFSPTVDTISSEEVVVEIVVRSQGMRKGVERSIEGWRETVGACSLKQLPSLSRIFAGKPPLKESSNQMIDPTQNLTFNLNLTAEQQAARAQVPLPYAHEGEIKPTPNAAPAIYYDPDSADDMDDEDPDEDLDI